MDSQSPYSLTPFRAACYPARTFHEALLKASSKPIGSRGPPILDAQFWGLRRSGIPADRLYFRGCARRELAGRALGNSPLAFARWSPSGNRDRLLQPFSDRHLETEQEQFSALKVVRGVQKRAIGILLFFAVASLFFWSFTITSSVILGGIVGIVSFELLIQLISRLLKNSETKSKANLALIFFLKYPLLFALLALLFWKVPIRLEAFGIGFLSLTVSVLLQTLKGS